MAITTTGDFAKEEADELLRRVTSQIARATKSQGIDEMHDLRVAIRRFTRILAVLKPCFPRSESRRMRSGLKRIMLQAGDVRNYDIAVHLITRIELPESGSLVRHYHIVREQAATTLKASLQRWTSRNLSARWRAALKSDRPRGDDARFCAVPIDITIKRILPDLVAEHFHDGEAAVKKRTPAHKIHRFRIAAKHFRYTLDFFAPFCSQTLSALVDRLKDVQTLLGDINDCATVRRIVKEETTSESDKAVRKDILSALKKRQRKKTEEFQEQFAAEFSNASVLRQWQDSVHRGFVPERVSRKPSARYRQ